MSDDIKYMQSNDDRLNAAVQIAGNKKKEAAAAKMSAKALRSSGAAPQSAPMGASETMAREILQSSRGFAPTNNVEGNAPAIDQVQEDKGAVTDSGKTAGSMSGAPESLQKAEPADGIEILVKLAESGEIDPKNVDIIDVTDKFLRAIAAAPKENLRQSGKVLFHACVLLRMKAEALLAAANYELDHGDDFLDFDEADGPIIYDSADQPVGRQITLHDLERALVRKAHTRQNRQRRVTLDQLINALRDAEKIEKSREERQPRARIDLSGHHEVNEYDDILELAHDEDIETTIERIDHILDEYLQTGEMMHLLKVIKLLDRGGDWVEAFLAVLFLSNAGKITLEQEHFWGPLYVVRCERQPQQPKMAGNA